MNWLKSLLSRRSSAPATTVGTTLQKEPGPIYVLRLSGTISKATLDRVQALAVTEFSRGISDAKVLMVLAGFQGWKRGDDWGNLDFFLQYEKNIAKIAAVGDPKWSAETLTFLAAGHRSGQVRYFAGEDESAARAWLRE